MNWWAFMDGVRTVLEALRADPRSDEPFDLMALWMERHGLRIPSIYSIPENVTVVYERLEDGRTLAYIRECPKTAAIGDGVKDARDRLVETVTR